MNDENGVWRTVSGRKIFIKKGQSLTDAMRESGKFKDEEIKESGGKDRKAKAAEDDKTSVREDVKKNSERMKKEKVIAVIPKGKVTTDLKTARSNLEIELSKNGGIVTRKDFGDVQVGSRLKRAAAYIRTAAEVAAMSAVPSVIRDGVLINEHQNHKGREYSSYVFAGNVSIGGKVGIVAVVVTKTTGNFYKIHRVLTPDGKDLEIKNDTK